MNLNSQGVSAKMPSYLLSLHHAEEAEHAEIVVDPNVTPVDPAQAVPVTNAVNLLGKKH
jgi:hypothetical protein